MTFVSIQTFRSWKDPDVRERSAVGNTRAEVSVLRVWYDAKYPRKRVLGWVSHLPLRGQTHALTLMGVYERFGAANFKTR